MRTSFWLFMFLAAPGCGGILPQREETVGSCTQEADCSASGQVCKANQCVACSAHTDCASQVCDSYGDLGGVGQCVPASRIIYVDGTDVDGANCPTATGSFEQPICDLDVAIGQLKLKPDAIISLRGGPTSYRMPAIEQSTGPVVVVGPGLYTQGKTATLISTSSDARLQLGTSSTVVLDGVSIITDGITVSSGAKVSIRRSLISYLQYGATFDNATVTLDRDMFVQNKLGLTFNSSAVTLTNSLIVGNTANPSTNLIDFIGGSGVFQFNTIAYNSLGSQGAQVLNCVMATGLMVKNSIFAYNGTTQQLATGCPTVANSLIVGKTDSAPSQLKQDPSFEDPGLFDLRLKPADPINTQYLFDKAVQVNPATDKNVDHDYYGNPRPQGSGFDIGAFELPVP